MSSPAEVREAEPEAIATWDDRTVRVPGGNVQQSHAWGVHRAGLGWRAHYLLLDDGAAVLALGRPWPFLGGGRLYVAKGPVTAGAPPRAVADRLSAVAGWAGDAGYDAILADAEIPVATGYAAELRARGFHPVEEVGPSRHRVGVPIPPGADEDALLAGSRRRLASGSSRRSAAGCGSSGTTAGRRTPPCPASRRRRPLRWARPRSAAFERFYALLGATGERRGFTIGPRAAAIAWWRAALEAGHLVLLEARSADDAYLGAAIFYRNGERLTYANSGDVVALRHAQPGAVHLLLWRALQLAAREGRSELDLGGVDVAGARFEPRPGDAMYGLLEFKRLFGGAGSSFPARTSGRCTRRGHGRATTLARLGGGARRLAGSRSPGR